MARRKPQPEYQTEIPSAVMPLNSEAANFNTPMRGKPTGPIADLLKQIDRLLAFRERQGKSTVTVTVTVTVAQQLALRRAHKDWPNPKAFTDTALHAAAVKAFLQRPFFYRGVELVTP